MKKIIFSHTIIAICLLSLYSCKNKDFVPPTSTAYDIRQEKEKEKNELITIKQVDNSPLFLSPYFFTSSDLSKYGGFIHAMDSHYEPSRTYDLDYIEINLNKSRNRLTIDSSITGEITLNVRSIKYYRYEGFYNIEVAYIELDRGHMFFSKEHPRSQQNSEFAFDMFENIYNFDLKIRFYSISGKGTGGRNILDFEDIKEMNRNNKSEKTLTVGEYKDDQRLVDLWKENDPILNKHQSKNGHK